MGTKNNPGQFDCYEAADPDEPMFVLLARDPLAPDLVREWVDKRLHAEGASFDEREQEKLREALRCANDMEDWFKVHPKPKDTSA